MGKRVLFFNLITIGLLSLLLNFSCSMPQQNIDKENKEESLIINNVFDKDLSALSNGDSFEISGFDDNTVFKLKNFSLSDGVYITPIESKKSYERGLNNGNFHELENGNYLILPNKDGNLEFKKSDFVFSGERIRIAKFNKSDEMIISAEEHKNKQFVEKYYYVDFSENKWDSLSKAAVAVICENSLGNIIKVFTEDGTEYSQGEIMNLSNYRGFSIYHYGCSEKNAPFVLRILGVENVENTSSLTQGIHVLYVPQKNSSKYQLTLTFEDSDKAIEFAQKSNYYFEPRKQDGSFVKKLITPYIIPDDNKVVLYLGELDEDFYFNLMLDSNVNLSFVEAESEYTDKTKVNLANEGNIISLRNSDFVTNFVTIPFYYDKSALIKATGSNKILAKGSYTGSSTGIFSLSNGNSIYLNYYGPTEGFLLVYSPETVENPFFKLDKGDVNDVTCREIIWNESSNKYICTCAEHSEAPKTDGLKQLITYKDLIFKGTYTTPRSFGEYGTVTFSDGRLSSSVYSFNSYTTGTSQKDRNIFTIMYFDKDNPSISILFEIKRVTNTDTGKEFSGTLICSGKDVYENVVFASVNN